MVNVMRIKWLHLSDIHFNYKNFDSTTLRQDFISRIQEISANEPFTHLFLTGDILFQNAEASRDTLDFIKTLIDTVNVGVDHVFLVPGNHDHDRNQTIEYTSNIYAKEDEKSKVDESERIAAEATKALLGSFEKYNSIYSTIWGDNYYNEDDIPHHVDKSGAVNIIKINTAWLDTKSNTEETLCIGSYQLQQVLLNEAETLKSGINIAVGHHPIEDLLPLEQKRLLQLFQRHGIGLYFCGHRHKPDIVCFHEYDVLQFTCPGGYNDGYSEGGYIWGIIDTDCDLYKAEVYAWNDGSWSIESKVPNTNQSGVCFFNSKRFKNNSNISAFDIKTYNGHMTQKQIEQAIGAVDFSTTVYDQPDPLEWMIAENTIEEFARKIETSVTENRVTHLFPLAPIPILLKLGFELQNNSKIIIHQYDRDTDLWVYNKEKPTITVQRTEQVVGAEDLVISISTSAIVSRTQIETSIDLANFDYVEFKTADIELGWPLYNIDVVSVAKAISSYLNSVASGYRSVHIFAAIPAGLAIELGRRLLKSICANIHTYQFSNRRYEHAITINPIDIKAYQSEFVRLPVVGRIACGPQNDAVYETDSYLPFPASLLGSGQHFVLRAKGDSMINAGICDGDYVVVHQQDTADSGQIVVACIENETTLKRLVLDEKKRRVILHPENNDFADIEVKDVIIQGVVVKVIKDVV